MARSALICGWLLGAGLLTAASGCDLFTKPDERIARAEQLIDKGAYSEAMVELKIALEKLPDDARAQLAVARASLQLGSPDAATRALDLAEKGGADPAKVADLRARILLQIGNFEGLLAATEPGSSAILAPQRELLRMRALLGLNRYVESIELARRLRANDATAAPATVVLAEAYARLGNAAGALALLDATVKAHPASAEGFVARGRLLQVAGRGAEAEESWRSAAAHAAGQLNLLQRLNTLAGLAELQLARGDYAAARVTQQEMLVLAPEGALAAVLGARLILVEGKTSEAVAALQELITRHADFDEVRVALASAQLAAGSLRQAQQQAAEIAQKNPGANNVKLASDILRALARVKADTEDYWLSSAGIHVALSQPAMARIALKKAQAAAPESTRALTALAQLELRTGNLAEAHNLATSISAKEPDNPNSLALIAEVYRTRKQYPQAASTLERLWALQPSAATALALARAREMGKLGNEALALKAWVDANPKDARMRGAYADALRRAGENRAAIAEFEAVVAALPESAAALNNLAWLYYLEKDAKALPMAKRAWQLSPRVPSVADTYGWLLAESGLVRDGRNVLETAYHDGGIADPETRYHFAAALAKTGDAAKAKELLKDLLDETPEFSSRADASKLAATL
jgi:tetratricopeptide (TPR) repeat protein